MPFDFDESAPNPEEFEYSAAEERVFNMAQRTNGVYPQVRIVKDDILDPQVYVGQSLQVVPGPGLSVILSPGLAHLMGTNYINTEPKPIDVLPGMQQDIVINLDLVNQKVFGTRQARSSGVNINNGLIRAVDTYQLGIATVTPPSGATGVNVSDITDHRLNTTLCPDGRPVCGLVGSAAQADTRMIMDQFQSQLQANTEVFETWFSGLQDTLDGDVAGNLYNMIDNLRGTVTNVQGDVTNVQNAVSTKAAKSVSVNVTLSSSSWVGTSAPYTQTVTVAGMKPDPFNTQCGPNASINLAQFREYRECGILGYSQGEGTAVIRAWERKPTINIPITFLLFG